ncbi:ABA4-like family protein [Rhizobium sp. LjRoot254]|uniref:ABA4-like family protein n=1 Tax=Rhizobium sp. LjRoot254 TaxID=3342297 RepID=UPI003ED06C53
MSFAQGFSIASTAAMAGWLALLLLPRWHFLVSVLRYGLIGTLSVAYAVLIMIFFFRVEGGGFNTIGEVRALFMSDGGLLAGWIHYLAFDLFVGMWIAEQADRIGMSRLLQAPILIATFMFGPIGLLIYLASRTTLTLLPSPARELIR